MEKFKEYLVIGGIVIFTLVLYLIMPNLMSFVADNSKGTRGIIFLSLVSLVLVIIYYFFGYRKMELVKVALLILFIAAMIWLYFNYRTIDIMISSRYGQGVATIVCLILFILIWFISRFMI